ncbi:MAG TPA: hypothetical protein VJQ47_09290 [Steroidobacteraceae bacterium]|nr:hypothetical protein [Steroidobacteraceae bacterium]
MRPSAEEVMHSIIWTFDAEIAPDLSTARAKSLALTTSNLLRHVLLRMQREAYALWDDNRELRQLLARMQGFFAQTRDSRGHDQAIPEVLARKYAVPGAYRGVAELEKEAFDLREAFGAATVRLHSLQATHSSDEQYRQLRAAIREYLEHLMKRESRWIDEAFVQARR